MLRRWGLLAEDCGAVSTDHIQERTTSGDILLDLDSSIPGKQWQHPWHLVHRVSLHEKLKALATGDKEVGPPVKLYTSSKVVSLDPERGEVKLESGETVTADVVLGADGLYVSRLHHNPKFR